MKTKEELLQELYDAMNVESLEFLTLGLDKKGIDSTIKHRCYNVKLLMNKWLKEIQTTNPGFTLVNRLEQQIK